MGTALRLADAEAAIRERMSGDRAPSLLTETFLHYVRQLAQGATGLLSRADIAPVEAAPDLDTEADRSPAGRAALGATVMIKLNGGLGTSMGLDRAKSLLPAREGLSFLDLIARQVLRLRETEGCPLPLLFMNSFRTDADTRQALAVYPHLAPAGGPPLGFLQHRVPKLRADTLAPVTWPDDPSLEWCPPGHGDLYTALQTTGLLRDLLARGFRYAFVSNADNLGATLDPNILGYLAQSGAPFLMEVADRTAADRKGGHVARLKSGGLTLRESAQCPDDEADDFQDIGRYRYFNTNNLWLDLPALHAALQARRGILGLPLIRNLKTVDPRVKTSTKVFQLETAMGAALSVFPNAAILRVPRTRFAPVKTTEDLLMLWSDLYTTTPAGHVLPAPERAGQPPPDIRLDPDHYRLVDDFRRHFPRGAPSLLRCRRLVVRGDIIFGAGVRVEGDVALAHKGPEPLTIPDGAILRRENPTP